MKTYTFNGERWHLDERPVWRRVRRWFSADLREIVRHVATRAVA